MSHIVQVELSPPLAERVARLVQEGIYEDEAAAIRAAAEREFLPSPPLSSPADLGEFIRAYRQGEISPSPDANMRIRRLAQLIQERGGMPFDSVEDALDYTRRRNSAIVEKYDERIYGSASR